MSSSSSKERKNANFLTTIVSHCRKCNECERFFSTGEIE